MVDKKTTNRHVGMLPHRAFFIYVRNNISQPFPRNEAAYVIFHYQAGKAAKKLSSLEIYYILL